MPSFKQFGKEGRLRALLTQGERTSTVSMNSPQLHSYIQQLFDSDESFEGEFQERLRDLCSENQPLLKETPEEYVSLVDLVLKNCTDHEVDEDGRKVVHTLLEEWISGALLDEVDLKAATLEDDDPLRVLPALVERLPSFLFNELGPLMEEGCSRALLEACLLAFIRGPLEKSPCVSRALLDLNTEILHGRSEDVLFVLDHLSASKLRAVVDEYADSKASARLLAPAWHKGATQRLESLQEALDGLEKETSESLDSRPAPTQEIAPSQDAPEEVAAPAKEEGSKRKAPESDEPLELPSKKACC